MKKRTTKSALALSFLAMLLCCAMLVGTTYAWFTDSVTSGNNKIVAGNLDIELNVKVGDTFTDATKVQNTLFGVDLWEPGVVAYETFEVVNAGTLALKYDLSVKVTNKNYLNGKSLDEVIKIGVYDGEVDTATMTRADLIAAVDFKSIADETARVKGEVLSAEAGKNTKKVTLVAYWEPTANDNDYNANNGKATNDTNPLFIEFGVVLTATQATVESDSFGKDYDKDATMPGIETVTAAIEQGAKDSNASIIAGILALAEENGEPITEEEASKLVYFDESGLTLNEDGEYEITLHFEEGSDKYVSVTYKAVKALIGDAVNAYAANIKSIQIAAQPVRELNGEPIEPKGDDAGWWVEADLRAQMSEAGGLAEALKLAGEEGLPVFITDMNGTVQTYRMRFDVDALAD